MLRKKIAKLTAVLTLAAVLTACKQADVIGKTAVTSFDKLMNTLGDQVTFDDSKNSWVLVSPTGEYFEWSKDFSSDVPDATVEFDAAPFLSAGLDVNKLPGEQYVYDEASGRIRMPYELGQDAFTYSGDVTAKDTFQNIVDKNRKLIGYHAQLDHYGIALGNGNMFEWAKDMAKNDKDMVFVLNPQPFIDAGVDPAKVEGWVFGKVKVDNGKGKMVEVDKLLKPFDLN
ncbi:hypothetical protein Ana3638_06960 [Anaerocolumna sedimenticola]|uniref:Lipoprotein n=1 Tax=Anaerocolumna sedimenticola TaxID=2696063 RepID=A0A6P1TK92_9FIRM|nr:hypothetical protein [Anaerocolumna sedimenticola]QHQ60539.1 hypothetical protein Ana3638_06960 [Anaerocolumna sedimenticola]